MEFKEAMRIWKRMCRSCECDDCPMATEKACQSVTENYDESLIESALAKWAAEHPEKTIADDFFGKHPNALGDDNGTPRVCAEDCGYVSGKDCKGDCDKCWRRPLEEV